MKCSKLSTQESNSFILPTVPPAVSFSSGEALDSEQIKLTWNKPDTKCGIDRYFISYTGKVLWDNDRLEEEKSTEAANETTEITVGGLTPYTEYSFCIVAQNSEGNGTESTCTDVTTLEGGK